MLPTEDRPFVPPPRKYLDGYARERIRYRAVRLGRAFRLSDEEVEDLEQEFAVEVVRASYRFDPSRSRWRTFLSRVLDRRYAHEARRLRSERRRRTPVQEPVANGLRPMAVDSSHTARGDLRFDVAVILANLSPRLRRIAATLMLCTPNEAAAQLGMHRSTVYRHIAKLRDVFLAHGYEDSHSRRATNRRGRQM